MLLGAILALLLLASWALAAWVVAQRLFPEQRALRGLATLVTLPWLLNGVFWLLAGAGLFRLGPAVGLGVGVAAGCGWWRRREIRETLTVDLGRLSALARLAFSDRAWLASGPLVALLALRVLRGTIFPPLAWDALTHRLFKAGVWVQTGSWILEPAPDAWGYYRFFPAAGEVLWAWAMLPFSSDAGIAAAGALVWLGVLLALYLASRSLGAGPRPALLTALATGAMPVLLSFVTSGYVHPLVVLYVLAGAVFARELLRSRQSAAGLAGAGSFALAWATHPGALPLVAVGILALGIGFLRRPGIAAVSGAVVATAVAWPWALVASVETGSPLYPLQIEIGDVELFAGHPQLDRLHRGDPFPADEVVGPSGVVAYQLWDPGGPRQEMLSFGPGVTILLALAGIAVAARRADATTVLLTTGLLLAVLLPVLAPATAALRVPWGAPMLGRHLLPGVAPLICLGAMVGGSSARLARGLAILLGVAWGWPRGFGALGWEALGGFGLLMGPVVLVAIALLLGGRRLGRTRTAVALAAAGLVVASVFALEALRGSYRATAWQAAGRAATYDLHPLSSRAVSAWPLWAALAEAPSLVVAYTAGWDGIGHNWYRYPFLGSRLQHRVVYVPVSVTGEVLDYQEMDRVIREARFDAWLGRLLERRVDVLVAAPPETLEARWAEDHPQVWRPLAGGIGGGARAYRLDRGAAQVALGR